MTSLTAGSRLTAAAVNAALPLYALLLGAVSKTSSTTLSAVTGFAIPLEANSTYVMDGYLAYIAGATGDLKIAFVGPTGTTGHWCLYGLSTASTGSFGDLDARRQTAFGTGTTQAIGGSDSFSGSLAAVPRLYVVTSSTAGDFTMQYAQNTSSATATTISSGTWIRAVKVA
jgi:hypothetical protein